MERPRPAHGEFTDGYGRTLNLRGVNLGGSSKVPIRPDGATHLESGFFAHRDVSFVGRPFPLAEADEHFDRIHRWGFRFVRLVVTWEAIEHEAPDRYDADYLDYLCRIIEAADRHDVAVIIDPHQDAWSRFSGGDGAPGWTLEAAGFRLETLHDTGAAFLHQLHKGDLPRMIWTTNRSKLASATMFTLLFGGNDFAPGLSVGDLPVQEFLQNHFIAAFTVLAARVKSCGNVIGFDSLNEPSSGYIGRKDLETPGPEPRIGAMPTPAESMLLGEGFSLRVRNYRFTALGSLRWGKRLVNPHAVRAWRDRIACVWRREGVWDISPSGRPAIRLPDHFSRVGGRRVDFSNDYLGPFLDRLHASIRGVFPDALLFVQSEPGTHLPTLAGRSRAGRVGSPHWYDGVPLMLGRAPVFLGADPRRLRPIFGRNRIRRSYARQVGELRSETKETFPGAPFLIGEVGIPFPSGKSDARGRSGERAMDRSLTAMDDSLASYALWNYTADNHPAFGDRWNGEDFSIFAPWYDADRKERHGRALNAVVRPYPTAIAGRPLLQRFDARTRRFELRFDRDAAIDAPTEIFLPVYHYPSGCEVTTSRGRIESDPERQVLRFFPLGDELHHHIVIRPKSSSLSGGR